MMCVVWFIRKFLQIHETRANVYYETFDDFKKGINDCLSRVENEYKTELDTLPHVTTLSCASSP